MDDFFSLLKRSFSAKQGRLVKAFASKRITGDMLERTWKNIHLLEVLCFISSLLMSCGGGVVKAHTRSNQLHAITILTDPALNYDSAENLYISSTCFR